MKWWCSFNKNKLKWNEKKNMSERRVKAIDDDMMRCGDNPRDVKY
jgi:hypothetical protein